MLVTTFLIRWKERFAERTDATAESTYGRREGFLPIGAAASISEAYRIADELLLTLGRPQKEITAAVLPVTDSDYPYINYDLGDYVVVPDEDLNPSLERVVSISLTMDNDTGQASITLGLREIVLAASEKLGQASAKMTPGALQGGAVVQPVAR